MIQSPGAFDGLDPWETLWAPYDEATYAAVLAEIKPDDVVLDIGAGDLRLARRMATIACQVIAWEIRPELAAAWSVKRDTWNATDHKVTVVCTDARSEPVPPGVTVAVLLMRHCTHYALYAEKLRAAGCRRLLTNARWGMGVEVIDLAPAAPFDSISAGWYACRRCGATGWAVEGCPECAVRTIR